MAGRPQPILIRLVAGLMSSDAGILLAILTGKLGIAAISGERVSAVQAFRV